jgi:hypothetical protein
VRCMAGQGELSSRPSREEMRDALQLCVSTNEAERMFERQIAAMASLQHKLEDRFEDERDVRQQALSELRDALMNEVGVVRAELEAQVHAQLPPGRTVLAAAQADWPVGRGRQLPEGGSNDL